MSIKTVLLLFSLIFLSACGGEKISDLESKLEALKFELKQATDPATVAKLQNEIKVKQAKQIARIEEMETLGSHLWEKLEKTGDKKSCEELLGQIEQLDKDIGNLIVEAQIYVGFTFRTTGPEELCTETGYLSGQYNPKFYDGKAPESGEVSDEEE